MERGLSGAEQDSTGEDINRVVRHLATLLLCYCLIADLYQVIAGRKSCDSAAAGPANITAIGDNCYFAWRYKTPAHVSETKAVLSVWPDLFSLTPSGLNELICADH